MGPKILVKLDLSIICIGCIFDTEHVCLCSKNRKFPIISEIISILRSGNGQNQIFVEKFLCSKMVFRILGAVRGSQTISLSIVIFRGYSVNSHKYSLDEIHGILTDFAVREKNHGIIFREDSVVIPSRKK